MDKITEQDYSKLLFELAVILYGEGPEDNNIWKRARGNVSILSNHENLKTQWYNAIDTLSKGGGGNITLKSFIEEVKKDFPDFD